MELPTEPSDALRINPKRLVIYSKPKAGKTSAFAGLENNLILDLESGTDFLKALKIKINNLEEIGEIGEKIKSANKPYKYITVDTITALEDMVLPLAKKLYQKTPKQNLGLIVAIL